MISVFQNSIQPVLAASILVSASALMAQGTANLSPEFPTRGSMATISFDATGGPLASTSPVVATIGFDGFQSTSDVTLTGTSPNWSATFNVPSDATSIDLVFKNSGSTVFDNNGGSGVDWQFVVSETQNVEPGVSKVDTANGGGFLFRVWAPDASSASVVGDFNGFAGSADEMVFNAATDIWTAHVPGANAGDEYKFLLDGSKFRRDPRGRQVSSGFGNSVIVDPSAFTFNNSGPGTANQFRDWVIYQIHIGTLDTNGGSFPGQFVDLIPGRLDYLQNLGVNAIKVMPINEFPGTSSGGYNLTDPFAIERDYGTPDEFRTFVDECHARGIAVIVDIVHNHYGPGSLELFDFQDVNNNGQDEPGIYFYDSPASLADTAFGPRPDYSEAEVRSFIKDSVEDLLNNYNVDGFRWDFTKAIRGTLDGSFNINTDIPDGIELLQDINSTTLSGSNIISIAEDLAGDSRITDPVNSVSGNANDGFGFDSQWVTNFHFQVVDQLQQTVDANLDMNVISSNVNGDFSRVHFIESHDEVWELNNKDRVPTRIDNADPESLRARKMSALGAGILLTTEGMPMIFQGSELLDNGGANNSWDDDEVIDFSRLSDPDIAGFNTLYRDLIRLRRNLDGASAGLLGDQTNAFNVDDFTKAIAYSRSNGGSTPGDTVVILANFSTQDFSVSGYEIGLPQSGNWFEIFNSDNITYGTDFGDAGVGQTVTSVANPQHGFAQRGSIQIGPRSMVILSQANGIPSRVIDWSMIQN